MLKAGLHHFSLLLYLAVLLVLRAQQYHLQSVVLLVMGFCL